MDHVQPDITVLKELPHQSSASQVHIPHLRLQQAKMIALYVKPVNGVTRHRKQKETALLAIIAQRELSMRMSTHAQQVRLVQVVLASACPVSVPMGLLPHFTRKVPPVERETQQSVMQLITSAQLVLNSDRHATLEHIQLPGNLSHQHSAQLVQLDLSARVLGQ